MTKAMDRARALLQNTTLPPIASGPAARGIMARLQSIRDEPMATQDIDPARVRVWHLQGRLQADLTEESVQDIIASIRVHGQSVPAIVRPVSNDPHADYEVIDGSRRRFACAALGRPLKAVVSDLTDLQAAVLTETADTARKHSVYETGLKWQAWLREGLFDTHEKLAAFVGGTQGDISFKLALAEVPAAFVRFIGGHEKVSRELGRRLAKLVGRARKLERLSQLQAELLGVVEQGGDPTNALGTVEQSFSGARKVAPRKVAPTVVSDKTGRATLHLDKSDRAALALRCLKGTPPASRDAFYAALEEFARDWWAQR
jgi:ParB family transcriptional regulator, chromosome partitioning protein